MKTLTKSVLVLLAFTCIGGVAHARQESRCPIIIKNLSAAVQLTREQKMDLRDNMEHYMIVDDVPQNYANGVYVIDNLISAKGEIAHRDVTKTHSHVSIQLSIFLVPYPDSYSTQSTVGYVNDAPFILSQMQNGQQVDLKEYRVTKAYKYTYYGKQDWPAIQANSFDTIKEAIELLPRCKTQN